MKLERSDVEFAIWRKKVDKSLFEHNDTGVGLPDVEPPSDLWSGHEQERRRRCWQVFFVATGKEAI